MVRIAKNLWPLHQPVQTFDRWAVFRQSVALVDEIPLQKWQEEISKAELLKWMVSGEDNLAAHSSASLAMQLTLEMAKQTSTNQVTVSLRRRSDSRRNSRC